MTAAVLSGFERKARRLAILNLRGLGHVGAGYDELVRSGFRELAEQCFKAAERDCRGELTNDDGRRKGIDPRDLFTGPEARARKWASEELIEWWETHGRLTFDEYAEDVLRSACDELRAAGEDQDDDEGDTVVATMTGPHDDDEGAPTTKPMTSLDADLAVAAEAADETAAQNVRLPVTGYGIPAQRRERDRGAQLAHEARAFIKRFFYLRSDAAMDLFILWGCMTNLVDGEQRTVMDTLPLLCLDSPEPGSGKTRGIDMQNDVLCGNAKKVALPTAAAITGYIDRSQHTILQDESDTLFGGGGDSKKVRGIMLDSYSQGGFVTTGDRSAPGGVREVDVHVPYLWAGLRQVIRSAPVLNALRTRTLFCPLDKPPHGVKVERYRRKLHGDMADMIRGALKQWGKDNAPVAAELIPELPESIKLRDADLWEPLYITALLLGGDWPDRCERACVVLSQGGTLENDTEDGPATPLEFLLSDMATVFADRGNPERLASRDLVQALIELPSSPWRQWLGNDPKNVTVTGGKAIAGMVAARQVTPGVMKVDGMPVRGYERADLLRAGMPDLPATTEDDGVAW